MEEADPGHARSPLADTLEWHKAQQAVVLLDEEIRSLSQKHAPAHRFQAYLIPVFLGHS